MTGRERARRFIGRLLLLLPALLLAACVADPVGSGGGVPVNATSGVIVVNEGLWRQDNATLTLHDPASGATVQDYFAVRNPGRRLGDVANNIVVRGSRAYIVVSTSQTVEVVEIPSIRSLGTIRLPAGSDPRSLALVDDSTAWVTGVLDDSITELDLSGFATRRRIAVGPAPEGIATAAGRLFVANSGYGLLRRREPKAGTISVIDPGSGSEIDLLHPGPNPLVVSSLGSTGTLFVLYGMPHPDSVGGLVEYDPATLRELRRWPLVGVGTAGAIAFDTAARVAYVVATAGVVRIDLTTEGSEPSSFVAGETWPGTIFYSVGVRPGSGEVYVGMLKGFTLPGEVTIFDRAGALVRSFRCGLNPGTFGFFEGA